MTREENHGPSSSYRDEPRFRPPEDSPGIQQLVNEVGAHLAAMRSDINLILMRLDKLSAILEPETMNENRPVNAPSQLHGHRRDEDQLRQVRQGLAGYRIQVIFGLLVGVVALLVVIFLFRGVR
jgi:hypothetical protein